MNHRVLGVLSFGHLAVDLSAGALPATLPFLQSEFHLSYFSLAAIMTMAGVTSSIMQPIFGIVSDIAKARYFLPLGVLGALAGYAALGSARSYAMVIAFVSLMGLGSAIYHPEASKCAHAVSGRWRTTGMSYFAVGGNLGVALGPLAVSALFSAHGIGATVYFLVPAFVVGALVASVIPVIAQAQDRLSASKADALAPASLWALTTLIGVGALRSVVYTGILTFVPLYAVNVLHAPLARNGLLLFVFLGSGAAATLAAGRIADRYGARKTLRVSLALVPFALTLHLSSTGVLSALGLALCGVFLIGTIAPSVVLGQEYLPQRVGLASALMIGFTTGLGAISVAALGKIADGSGLVVVLWLLVAVAVATAALAMTVPAAQRIHGWEQSRALAGRTEA